MVELTSSNCGATSILARASLCPDNYCIGQRAFAQPSTEILRGEMSIAGKADSAEPKPGSDGDVNDECRGFELPLLDKARQPGDFKLEFVRYGLYSEEWEVIFLCGAGNGGGFHIYRVGAVGFCELALLFSRRDFRVGSEHGMAQTRVSEGSAADRGLVATAVRRVNDECRENSFADVEFWDECASDARRDEHGWEIVLDDGFGGATSGFRTDAAADGNRVIGLVDGEGAGIVLDSRVAPVFDERMDLTLESGDDGDFGQGQLPDGFEKFIGRTVIMRLYVVANQNRRSIYDSCGAANANFAIPSCNTLIKSILGIRNTVLTEMEAPHEIRRSFGQPTYLQN